MAKGKKRTKAPVDVKALMEALDDLGTAREYVSYVNLVIDVTASDSLIDYMLEAFTPQNGHAEVRHVLLTSEAPDLPMPSDLCVIVSGESLLLGDVAAASRRMGCPAVVIAEEGETYFAEDPETAAEILSNVPDDFVGIPMDDLVACNFGDERPLDDLGRWIVNNAPAKRVSMAADFAFLRHPLSMEITRLVALQNAGVGLVFIVPGADMPVITLNQAKLVLQIASIYGQPLDYGRIVEVAVVVAGAFGFRAIAREIAGAVPVLGVGVKGLIAYSGTLTMGCAAVDYFEEGGCINGLAHAISQAVSANQGDGAQEDASYAS